MNWEKCTVSYLAFMAYLDLYRQNGASLLAMMGDIMSDPALNNDATTDDNFLWSFAVGPVSRSTHRRRRTEPKPKRFEAIKTKLQDWGYLPAVLITPHTRDCGVAERLRALPGFPDYGEQAPLRYRVDGLFAGACYGDTDITRRLVEIHLTKGDAVFRARVIEASYARDEDETAQSFIARADSLAFDQFSVRDLFGCFSSKSGVLFGAQDGSGDIAVSDVTWRTRRTDGAPTDAVAMTLHDEKGATRLQRAETPELIQGSLGLLNRLSELAPLRTAAE